MPKFQMPYLIISRKKFEAEISIRAMEACEQVISEMGAELHDDLIHKLSVLRLHIDTIERFSSTRTIAGQMQLDLNNACEAVRRIARRMLHVRMEDDSFEKGIERLCRSLNTSGALRIQPSFEGIPKKIAIKTEIHLGRMIQELVQNALRHSSAWHVWVRIKWEPARLVVEVEDDGAGFAKIPEFISTLEKKHNTLRMRSLAIGAGITYAQGPKGLLATILYPYDASK
jgi:signal transduction histidine kinase